jgi:hypothetical protein
MDIRYLKISDDQYVPTTGTAQPSVTVVASGPNWNLRFGADVLSTHAVQQDARDAALTLVNKLGALVTP